MTDSIPQGFRIETVGHSTRFGAKDGPNPASAAKKARAVGGSRSSVREALRRIGTLEFEIGKMPTPEQISECFEMGGRKITFNQAIALQKYKQAIAGDVKAMQQIEDSIDGKLAQHQINTDVSLAELVMQSMKVVENDNAP